MNLIFFGFTSSFESFLTYQEIFDDQLKFIGVLARLNVVKVLVRLNERLAERSAQLGQILQLPLKEQPQNVLSMLNEHIHWILLISGLTIPTPTTQVLPRPVSNSRAIGFVIADDGTGETPLIPIAILHSLEPLQGTKTSPLLDFIGQLTQLMELLTHHSVLHMDKMSPTVTETLYWFFSRFSKSYLCCDASDYFHCPRSILASSTFSFFSSTSAHAQQLLVFFLQQIQSNIITWSPEIDVVVSIVTLLDTFARNRFIRTGLMKTEIWLSLAAFLIEHISAIPQQAHASLICTLSRMGGGESGEWEKNEYYARLTAMIQVHRHPLYLFYAKQKRFCDIVSSPSFTQQAQSVRVLMCLQDSLMMFGGLADSLDATNNTQLLPFFSSHIENLRRVNQAFVSIPEVITLLLDFWLSLVATIVQDYSNPVGNGVDDRCRFFLLQECVNHLNFYCVRNRGMFFAWSSLELTFVMEFLIPFSFPFNSLPSATTTTTIYSRV